MCAEASDAEQEETAQSSSMRLSATLTRQALNDFRREIRRSLDVFGPGAAERLRDRLMRRFGDVADGIAIGHRHSSFDAAPDYLRCVNVGPLLVVYDSELRPVVDGRRDIAAIVARRLGDP